MFKSNAPPVEAFVVLDESSRRPLVAGALISGSVKINAQAGKQLRSAEIIMFGRAVTHAAKFEAVNGEAVSLDFADHSNLFRINNLLAQEQYVGPGQPLTLNFNLQLPHRIEAPTTANPYTNETRYKGEYVETTHPLPPSFSMIAGARHFAVVEYNVQAVLQLEDEKYSMTVQLPEPLLVLLSNSGPIPQRQPMEFIKLPEKYSSSRLLGNSKSKRGSFTDRFSSNVPSVNVVMKASVPGIVTTGRPFEITVAAEINSPSAPSVSIPSILFRIVDLQFWKVTHLRCLRPNPDEAFGGHRVHESKAQEPLPLNALPQSALVQQQSGTNGETKIWSYAAAFESRIPGSACPSFSTFNISLSYRIKMTVEAEICGKKFEYEVDIPDIFVAPPMME